MVNLSFEEIHKSTKIVSDHTVSGSGTESYPVFVAVTDIRPKAGRKTDVQR